MADSALKGVFREFTCTYQVETGEIGTDPDGNPVPVVETRQLVVNFEAYSFPQLVFQPGADPKTVRGKGSCVSPAVMPSGIGPGSELAMTWMGVPGTLRILQVSADPLEVLDSVLGSEFIAEWRPT